VERANPFDDPRTSPIDVAREAADRIRAITGVETHEIALMLGSGWAAAVEHLGEVTHEIPARELPGFVAPTVPGHVTTIRSVRGRTGARILLLGARSHLYDGRGVRAVAHGARVASACGAKAFVMTNASGGIRPEWKPGTPVLISDHINFTATSPIEGANFVDMGDAYSRRLRDIARKVDATLDEGVYIGFRGPQYETPAEIRAARSMGADLVGMSTVIDCIAAREAGLDVLALALITNHAAGVSDEPLTHDAVLATGKAAEPRMAKLLSNIVDAIAKDL
jgi:purine-nucleoside phosphorylase